jgi:hypothetical protein
LNKEIIVMEHQNLDIINRFFEAYGKHFAENQYMADAFFTELLRDI